MIRISSHFAHRWRIFPPIFPVGDTWFDAIPQQPRRWHSHFSLRKHQLGQHVLTNGRQDGVTTQAGGAAGRSFQATALVDSHLYGGITGSYEDFWPRTENCENPQSKVRMKVVIRIWGTLAWYSLTAVHKPIVWLSCPISGWYIVILYPARISKRVMYKCVCIYTCDVQLHIYHCMHVYRCHDVCMPIHP